MLGYTPFNNKELEVANSKDKQFIELGMVDKSCNCENCSCQNCNCGNCDCENGECKKQK